MTRRCRRVPMICRELASTPIGVGHEGADGANDESVEPGLRPRTVPVPQHVAQSYKLIAVSWVRPSRGLNRKSSKRIRCGEPTLKLAFPNRNLLTVLLLARFKCLTSSNGSNTSVCDSPSLHAATDECSYQCTPLDDSPCRAKRTIRLIMGDWRQVPYLARRSGLTRLLFQPR
jgi:hypothetical protein